MSVAVYSGHILGERDDGKSIWPAGVRRRARVLDHGVPAQVRPYGVVEAGVERRRPLTDAERIIPPAGVRGPRGHEDGFAYGIGIGAEAPVSSEVFVGAEASVSRSEADTTVDQFRGIQLPSGPLIGVTERTAVHPRWSYAATARAGVRVTRSVALYGLAGFGGEHVRREVDARDDASVPTVTTRRTLDGFVYGAGAGLFLTDRLGVRVEYRRTDANDGYRPRRLAAGVILRL